MQKAGASRAAGPEPAALGFECNVCGEPLLDASTIFTNCGHFFCAQRACSKLVPGRRGVCELCRVECTPAALVGRGVGLDAKTREFLFKPPVALAEDLLQLIKFHKTHRDLLAKVARRQTRKAELAAARVSELTVAVKSQSALIREKTAEVDDMRRKMQEMAAQLQALKVDPAPRRRLHPSRDKSGPIHAAGQLLPGGHKRTRPPSHTPSAQNFSLGIPTPREEYRGVNRRGLAHLPPKEYIRTPSEITPDRLSLPSPEPSISQRAGSLAQQTRSFNSERTNSTSLFHRATIGVPHGQQAKGPMNQSGRQVYEGISSHARSRHRDGKQSVLPTNYPRHPHDPHIGAEGIGEKHYPSRNNPGIAYPSMQRPRPQEKGKQGPTYQDLSSFTSPRKQPTKHERLPSIGKIIPASTSRVPHTRQLQQSAYALPKPTMTNDLARQTQWRRSSAHRIA